MPRLHGWLSSAQGLQQVTWSITCACEPFTELLQDIMRPFAVASETAGSMRGCTVLRVGGANHVKAIAVDACAPAALAHLRSLRRVFDLSHFRLPAPPAAAVCQPFIDALLSAVWCLALYKLPVS